MKKWNTFIILFICSISFIYNSNALTNTITENNSNNLKKDFMTFNLGCKGYEGNIYIITLNKNGKNPNKYIFNKFSLEIDSENISFTKRVNGKLLLKRFKMENLQKINKIPLLRKPENKENESKCFEIVLNSVSNTNNYAINKDKVLEIITITLCTDDQISKKKFISEILKSKQCQLNSSLNIKENVIIDQTKINKLLKIKGNKSEAIREETKQLSYNTNEGANCCPKTSEENKKKDLELKKTLKEISETIKKGEIQKLKNLRLMKNKLKKQSMITKDILKKDELIKEIVRKREEIQNKLKNELGFNRKKDQEINFLKNLTGIIQHFQKKNINEIKNKFEKIMKDENKKKMLENMKLLNLLKNIHNLNNNKNKTKKNKIDFQAKNNNRNNTIIYENKKKNKFEYNICILKDRNMDYMNLNNAFDYHFNKVCNTIKNKINNDTYFDEKECKSKNKFCDNCCKHFFKIEINKEGLNLCKKQCENSIKELTFEVSAKKIIKEYRDNAIKNKNKTNINNKNITDKNYNHNNKAIDLDKIIKEYKQTVKNDKKFQGFIGRITQFQKNILKKDELLKIKDKLNKDQIKILGLNNQINYSNDKNKKNFNSLMKNLIKESNFTNMDKNKVKNILKQIKEIKKESKTKPKKLNIIENLLKEYKKKNTPRANKNKENKNNQMIKKNKNHKKEKDIIKQLISEYNIAKKKKRKCNKNIEFCPEKANLTKLLNLTGKQKDYFDNIVNKKEKKKNQKIIDDLLDIKSNTNKTNYKKDKESKKRKEILKKIKKDIKKKLSVNELFKLLDVMKKVKKNKDKEKKKNISILKQYLPHLFFKKKNNNKTKTMNFTLPEKKKIEKKKKKSKVEKADDILKKFIPDFFKKENKTKKLSQNKLKKNYTIKNKLKNEKKYKEIKEKRKNEKIKKIITKISSKFYYPKITKTILDKIKKIITDNKFDINKIENQKYKEKFIKIIKKLFNKEKEKEIRKIFSSIDDCAKGNYTKKSSISGPDNKSKDLIFEISNLKNKIQISEELKSLLLTKGKIISDIPFLKIFNNNFTNLQNGNYSVNNRRNFTNFQNGIYSINNSRNFTNFQNGNYSINNGRNFTNFQNGIYTINNSRIYKKIFDSKGKIIMNKNIKKTFEKINNNTDLTLKEKLILKKFYYETLNRTLANNLTMLTDCDTGKLSSLIPTSIKENCKDIITKKLKKIDEKLQIKFYHLRNFTGCGNKSNTIKNINGPNERTYDHFNEEDIDNNNNFKNKKEEKKRIQLFNKKYFDFDCKDKIMTKKFKTKMEHLINQLNEKIKKIQKERNLSSNFTTKNKTKSKEEKKINCYNETLTKTLVTGPNEKSVDIFSKIYKTADGKREIFKIIKDKKTAINNQCKDLITKKINLKKNIDKIFKVIKIIKGEKLIFKIINKNKKIIKIIPLGKNSTESNINKLIRGHINKIFKNEINNKTLFKYYNNSIIKIKNFSNNKNSTFNNKLDGNNMKKNIEKSCENEKIPIINPVKGPDSNSFDVINYINNTIKFEGNTKFTEEIEKIKRRFLYKLNKTKIIDKNISTIINNKLEKIAKLKIKFTLNDDCKDKISKMGKGIRVFKKENIKISKKIKNLCYRRTFNKRTLKQKLVLKKLKNIKNPIAKKICKQFIEKYVPLIKINKDVVIDLDCFKNATKIANASKPINGPNYMSFDYKIDNVKLIKENIKKIKKEIEDIIKEIHKIKKIKKFYNETKNNNVTDDFNRKKSLNKKEKKKISILKKHIIEILKKFNIVSKIEKKKRGKSEGLNRLINEIKQNSTTNISKLKEIIINKINEIMKKIINLKQKGKNSTKKLLKKLDEKKILFYKKDVIKTIKKISDIIKKKNKSLTKDNKLYELTSNFSKVNLTSSDNFNKSITYLANNKVKINKKKLKVIKSYEKNLKENLEKLKIQKINLKNELGSCLKNTKKEMFQFSKLSLVRNKIMETSYDLIYENKEINSLNGENLLFNKTCFNDTLSKFKVKSGPNPYSEDFTYENIMKKLISNKNKTSILNNCKEKLTTEKERNLKEINELKRILKEDCPDKDENCDKIKISYVLKGINYKSEDIIRDRELISKEKKYKKLCLNKNSNNKKLFNLDFGKNKNKDLYKNYTKKDNLANETNLKNGPSYKAKDIIVNPIEEKMNLLKKLKRRILCEKLRKELKLPKLSKGKEIKKAESIIKLEKEIESKGLNSTSNRINKFSNKSRGSISNKLKKDIQKFKLKTLKNKCLSLKDKFMKKNEGNKFINILNNINNGPDVESEDIILSQDNMNLLKDCIKYGFLKKTF